jgi:Zn-finger nucleic acid-binding protein
VTCPNCGAPMRLEPDQESLVCDYCHTVHFPETNAEGVRVLTEPSPLHCPVCAVPLVHAAIARQRMLYCDQCRGMLIGMGTFIAIVHNLRVRHEISGEAHQPDWTEMERKIQCPQCGQEMDTHPYGGGGNVIIEDCERCELNWLDDGELQRIVQAPDREYASDV